MGWSRPQLWVLSLAVPYIRFRECSCRQSPANAASLFTLAIAVGGGLVPGGPGWPSARPRLDNMPWAGLPPKPSAALSRTSTVHIWCMPAATRQSLGPRAVHSRTASRVGVSWLGYAHTWCQVSATRQSPGPRDVHSRTASRLGVSWLGWCTPGVSLLPHGRARAPEPSIAARRHGWGYPGWVGAHLVFCRCPTAEPGPQSRP